MMQSRNTEMRTGALALALVTLGVGQSFAGDSVNVPDGGFEANAGGSTPIRWHADRSAAQGDAVVRLDTMVARSGKASFSIHHALPAQTTVVSEAVELRVGRAYRLSAWIKCHGVSADPMSKYPTAVPACLSLESQPFTNHSPAVGGSSDWTRVEMIFIATRGKDRVQLHLGHNGSASGKAWFDDVALEEIDDIADLIPMETVRWYGNGYRYDDRGWIFVHIEGDPYERGYQYGNLVGDEIVQYITKLAIQRNGDNPSAGWRDLRFDCDSLFLRGYDKEYLTEMKGIADGAANADSKYDDRKLDLLDIVTINSVIDLGQMKRAMGVTPHGLTGESFLKAEQELQIAEEDHKCSAFAATGPATTNGEIVFGQIFMWSGYTGVHWNVITDIEPTKGHRLVYHTFPGGIHSGADFYINSAGIIIGETTVSQTPYEPDSTPQSNRIRKAAQYASSIDDVERILWEKNNGMYTNDWPIADIKTGEVAILLLGTHRKKLWRTSEDMAPFGTPGFLWANNNNRDDEVRKEYIAQPDDRPYDLVFSPWNRDVAFNEVYQRCKGKFDSNVGVRMWASSPINRAHACDGKITTTEMARELAFLAHFGKVTLREKFPQKGWRILPDLPGAIPHLSLGYSVVSPVYVTNKLKEARDAGEWSPQKKKEDLELSMDEVETDFKVDAAHLWRRTVYPATAAENWFVSASARYWRMLHDFDEDDPKPSLEKLANQLAELNRRYLYTVSRERDLVPVETSRVYDRFGPYLIPRIKGTFALHQLRLYIGTEEFLSLMRAIHERYAETEVTNAQLLSVVEEFSGAEAVRLVRQWIERDGLPQLSSSVRIEESAEGGWEVHLGVSQTGEPYHLLAHVIVETGEQRYVRRLEMRGRETAVTFGFDERPTKIEFNALNDFPADNPNFYIWGNLIDDFQDALIVYGTARMDEGNHTLARRWQETVANTYIEILLPLVKDSELSSEQAANHDLIVMGTLNDNRWFSNGIGGLPVKFGRNHFEWRGVTYSQSNDGLFLVVPNPFNTKRVMYILAANSALQLHEMTKVYVRDIPSWAVFSGEQVAAKGYHPAEAFEMGGSVNAEPETADTR